MSTSEANKVPTQTFLLPGQQFCVGLPWERAGLPRHGLPPQALTAVATENPFDRPELQADPCAGLEIGCCQVIRRLSSNSASSLLAMRNDAREGTALVAMRKLELPDAGMQDLLEHAHWASHFRHPNLARVYGSEAGDEGIFWVTEFVSGATLSEVNAACRKIGKGVPAGLALAIAHETALALAELHVPGAHAHGAVSDESLFITFEGHSKLLDLGLMQCIAGKVLRPEGLTAMAPYLAPEQVLHGRLPDPKTDVYALAALLYESLSGQKLANGFERQRQFVPPSSFNIALGRELDTVMLRALEADRAKRFSDAAEFARALKNASSPFMWKTAQRAAFVAQLFQTRKRREQVLLAGCEEILWKPTRVPTAPKLPAAVEPAARSSGAAAPSGPPKTLSMRASGQLPPPAPIRPRLSASSGRRLRPWVLALLASALAWVWLSGTAGDVLNPRSLPVLALRAGAALANVPPPAPATEPAMSSRELSEQAALRSLELARTLYSARPKPKAANRKKDDAPLPPWLQPRKGRR